MKKKVKKPENSERWLLTYSDLITLLVALFVVLYAMSNVSESKYEQLSQSLNASLGDGVLSGQDSVLTGKNGLLDGGKEIDQSNGEVDESSSNNGEGDGTSNQTDTSSNTLDKEELENIRNEIQEITANSDIKGSITITTEKRGLVITFSDNLFFDSGKANIKSNMDKTFSKIASLLKSTDNSILVEGHTDNIPISNRYYSSNWQLSSIRAANVVEYLIDNYGITPNRLSAVGYGEYKPVADNDTEPGRKKNRRVNIVILYDNNN